MPGAKNERQLPPELLARWRQELLFVQLPPAEIDHFNKILEAYDNLTMVSTVGQTPEGQALLACWVTADTRPELVKLLARLHVAQVEPPEFKNA